MASRCQALNLSDERRCDAPASSNNGLFCSFHARQCFGLYKGYKRRNTQLDDLTVHPPPLLQDKALHELQIAQEDDEHVLEECHQYLFQRYALLDRVIRARRLHTSRFYAFELDYGHENYVNQLSAQKTPLLRALEKVVRRLAEVLYEKQKWFEWVRKLEDNEERERDAEKKKVKQEAALFRRHLKELEVGMRRQRAEEDEKRQSEYLDKMWEEVQESNGKVNEEAIQDSWDPIEDSIEDERGNYIDLLRHFLWQHMVENGKAEADTDSNRAQHRNVTGINSDTVEDSPSKSEDLTQSNAVALKSKNAKRRARQKANSKVNQPDVTAEPKEQAKPGATIVESMDEMRERLRHGQKYQGGVKWLKKGTYQKPEEYETRSPPLRSEEIDQLMGEIAEIKQLLFCRILLSHASLLPIAIRSNSVDEFLANEKVTNTDLRDLCLKLEQPNLQELRDACADLKREDLEIDGDGEDNVSDGTGERQKYQPKLMVRSRIPTTIQTRREKAIKARRETTEAAEPGTLVDFGVIDDQSQYRIQKIKVKVCGKDIYNYPSEKAMSRGGWLQFSIIAKDCNLADAVRLCRNWDEFYELVTLTMYNYFPASGWLSFVGSQIQQQLFKLGFFPYYRMHKAEDYTYHHQTSRGHTGPRQHQMIEVRNFIGGQMKRNDPVTRRFIQYIAMLSCRLVMFVRDVSTGNVLVKPPEQELWLARQKIGLGRAVKNDWTIIRSVGPDFINEMEIQREWSLDFKEYFDIIIWDLEPGEQFPALVNDIQAALFKAHRVKNGTEIYKPAESILRSIGIDEETRRAYDLKAGEEGESVWHQLHDPRSKHRLINENPLGDVTYADFPDDWIYNESDRLEDEILFPADQMALEQSTIYADGLDQSTRLPNTTTVQHGDPILSLQGRKIHSFENQGPNFARFVLDLDTDEELSDTDLVEVDAMAEGSPIEKKDEDQEEHEHDDSDWSDDLDGEVDDGEGEFSAAEPSTVEEMLRAWENWRGQDLSSNSSGQGTRARDVRNELPLPKLKKLKRQKKLKQHAEMEEDWEIFMEREKAAVFHDCWHRANLEPNAGTQWGEYGSLMIAQREWLKDSGQENLKLKRTTYTFKMMAALKVDHHCHRRIVKDARMACEFVSLFFDTADDGFLASRQGAPFRSSLLFKQIERAGQAPNRRSRMSNKTRPKEHFKEWDDRRNLRPRYPKEWNLVIRPIIAWLYREGVVCTSYESGSSGPAICLTEPDRPGQPDLYFDWRPLTNEFRLPPSLANPMIIEPLIDQARVFAKPYSKARFSVLRLWSAPHFWPLMIGYNNRANTSFTDGLGRTWEWRFVPKDMPYSEWSMHKVTQERLTAFDYLSNPTNTGAGKVVARIDTILVMAKDTQTCRFLTTAAVFAINTRPWRLELDPWKSWFNVDMAFLETLDRKWWE